MKRDIYFELADGFHAFAAEHQYKDVHLPYEARNPNLPLACAEAQSNFAALKYSGYICPEYRRESMIIVPLAEAKNNLSKLVDDAAAGQIITIAKHGRALARLVPVSKPRGQRIGAMKGKLVLPEDFDAPLPDDMLDAFEDTRQ
ncbi:MULTISPECIES: type II toxin-antitoxin system Phd/YefM family antitoxin [unclassified Pseudomonas]|uniref:type II toxin-antitoxin system Phd/YefM family antitoxin n=1 Tax=unclassified Pseudomonas TaxID=196821 RepID=UPI002114D66B|nr:MULTISPECIES: type II toxin-antitoxin system Phd/YefM family antitoxin [unclassified Pseudomonas]